MEELVSRLARSCARGCRQLELVNELLVEDVKIHKVYIPGKINPVNKYGSAYVGGSSFVNLKKRLAANGFYFKYNNDLTEVRMRFSR